MYSGLFSVHLSIYTLGCLYLLMIWNFHSSSSQKILMLFGIRFSRNKCDNKLHDGIRRCFASCSSRTFFECPLLYESPRTLVRKRPSCSCIHTKCHSLHYQRGDKGIRTLDPLLARQVLSQLSYTPIDLATTYSPISSPT